MPDLILTVITSAVVATVVGEGISWLKEKSRLQVTGRHEALQIATALEGYALDCSLKLASHTTAESSDGNAGSFMAVVPDFPEFTVGEAILRPKKARLASRLAEFPQIVRQADQEVEFWHDVLRELDCARNAAKKHTARVGLESIDMAKQIRKEFGLPERTLVFGEYNIQLHLEEVLGTVEAT